MITHDNPRYVVITLPVTCSQPECFTVGVDGACARGAQVLRFRSGVTLDTGTDCRSRARSCIETCVAYLSASICLRRRQSSKQPCSAVYSEKVPHFRCRLLYSCKGNTWDDLCKILPGCRQMANYVLNGV